MKENSILPFKRLSKLWKTHLWGIQKPEDTNEYKKTKKRKREMKTTVQSGIQGKHRTEWNLNIISTSDMMTRQGVYACTQYNTRKLVVFSRKIQKPLIPRPLLPYSNIVFIILPYSICFSLMALSTFNQSIR